MKKCFLITFIVLLLFDCQQRSKTEVEKQELSSQMAIEGVNEVDNKTETTDWYTDISSILDSKEVRQDDLGRTDEILDEFGRLLSGSWTEYPDRVDGERELSWGTVAFANFSYTLIDFIAAKQVYIMGMSEGGPIGYDYFVAIVTKIEIDAPDTFRIYYVDDSSGLEPRRGEFVFHYDSETDTISIVELGGQIIDSPEIQYRVSERLE